MLEKRTKWIFMSCAFTAGFIFLQMGLYLLHVLLGWKIGFNLIELCKYGVRSLGFSSIDYFLDVLVFYTIFLFIWKFFRQMVISVKMYKKLLVYQHETLTNEMNQKYNSEKQDFSVICSTHPVAMTIGFFNPKIILSTGLLGLLEEKEVEAVIHHEQHHKDHYDPLKNFLLHLFAAVMWYIPILKWLQQRHKILTEVLADNYAIKRLGTSVTLGNALMKLLKNGYSTQMSFSYVSFADTSINYRIKKLIDPKTEFSMKLPITSTIISLFMIVLLCAMFVVVLF